MGSQRDTHDIGVNRQRAPAPRPKRNEAAAVAGLALVSTLTAARAWAQTDFEDAPEEGTYTERGATPTAGAPLPTMTLSEGRFTLQPQLAVLEITVTVPGTDEVIRHRVPAIGVTAMYHVSDRVAVFGGAYGTGTPGQSFETNVLSGDLRLVQVVGGLGVAADLLGLTMDLLGVSTSTGAAGGPAGDFRVCGAVALLGYTLHAKLLGGTAGGARLARQRKLDEQELFQFSAFGAAAAIQAEWRPWRYVSVVPYALGWRLLAVRLRTGRDDHTAEPATKWHVTPGVDLWIYPFDGSDSHISAGALFAVTADRVATTYTLGYTMTWGE